MGLLFIHFCSISSFPLLGYGLQRKRLTLKLPVLSAAVYGVSLLLTPICLERLCLLIDSVDRKPKPPHLLVQQVSCFHFLLQRFQFNGRLTLLPKCHRAWCAAVPLLQHQQRIRQMSQGKKLQDPCTWSIQRLLRDLLWQKSASAVLCWRKLPTDMYCLLSLWHVEWKHLEPAGPREAWFILCLVKYGSLNSLQARLLC